jgi:hypothetical protein
MPITAVDLFRTVGLSADGPVVWGSPVRAGGPGIYVVEWPAVPDRAPVDISVVGTWLSRVPTLAVDGERPTGKGLAARLAAWCLPGEPVVFIGSTGKSIARRVEAFYATPLGDARPHAAGQWLKALTGLKRARVWWAPTSAAEEYEDACFEAFAAAVPTEVRAALPAKGPVLPFANRRHPSGAVRPDGVTGSTVEPPPSPEPTAAAGKGTARRSPSTISDEDLIRVNELLQDLACGEPGLEITPAQANAEGAIRRLLGETPDRPASALGQLLRAGKIAGAHQDLDGRWAIRCTRRSR